MPIGPGLVPNIAGLQRLGGPVLDVYGTFSAAEGNLLGGLTDDFSVWITNGNNTITVDVDAGPYGGGTADLFTVTAAGASLVYRTFPSGAAGPYKFSVFHKGGTAAYLWITTKDVQTWFNVSTGAVGTTGSGVTTEVTDVGGGWRRYDLTKTLGAGATTEFGIGLSDADGSLAASAGITGYLWHATVAPVDSDTATITGGPIVSGTLAGRENVWLPSSQASIALWLDGADRSTLTLDGSGNVSNWADKVGSGRSWDQSNASLRPQLAADGLLCTGGQHLNAPTGYSSGDLPTGSAVSTIVWVAKSVSSSTQKVFYWGDNLTLRATRAVGIRGGTVDAGINGYDHTTAVSASGTHLTAWRLNGTSSTINIDGGADQTATLGATPNTSAVTAGGRVGSWPGEGLDGTVREVLVFTTILSASDRAKVEGYLAWKWGLTLPSGHTYETTWPAATEDTASVSGTVEDAAVTGTLAATEAGADTASISGGPTVSGSLSATEAGSDAASVAGAVAVAGSLSATEAAGQDTAAATGTVLVSGTLAATESGQDAASFTGSVLVAGPLSATESGQDSASITGDVSSGVSGSLAATESGADTASTVGDVAVAGSQDALESGSDTAGLTGTVAVEGALAASEVGQDTASILEAAPAVIEEEPRRGGPALFYRRDLGVSRKTRKRTLDEILAELLPRPLTPTLRGTHGSEASEGRPRAGSGPSSARSRSSSPAEPRAPSIAASAAVQASRVVQEARQRRRVDAEVVQLAQQIMEHEHRVVRRRRATAAALLLSSPL